jgi:hypothetical protein
MTSNLEALLKSAEESARVLDDPELRKIAFQEVLRYSLRSVEPVANHAALTVTADARPGAKKRMPQTAKPNTTSAIRPDVASLDVSPDQSGLVSWGTLSIDWKKFCWILEAARLKGVDGLTNSEISFLVDKIFRESYQPKVVNNIKLQIKKGMVKSAVVMLGEREYQVWKILATGIKEVTPPSAAPAA